MEPIIKNKKFYKELRKKHVTILDPANTYISPEAEFELTVTICSGVKIIGRTKICSFSDIGANSIIRNSKIGRGTLIKENCVIESSVVENLCEIGPFAHLRVRTRVGRGAVVGNFVEIKKSTIGKNTKIKHHAYIGDAEIGKNVNIGAGTITCNYDGEKKHKTIIKDGAFIGVNNSLVAPVTIGKNAYTAAGSVITKDVPPCALAIARARQVNKEQWVKAQKLRKETREKLFKKGHCERIKKAERAQEIQKILENPSIKCPKCNDELLWNTNKKTIFCSCGYLRVDGDGLIIRIIRKND